VKATVAGQKYTAVTGRVLAGDALDAHNSFDAPNRVQPAAFTGATLRDSTLEARLPPHSVVVLTLAGGIN
jgi:alpha-N-arabinofuranosidase